MDIEAKIWKDKIPFLQIMDSYSHQESDLTGTVVIHAGRVKLPGKVKPEMTHAILEPVVDNPPGELRRIAKNAAERFPVNRTHIHHRVGVVLPGEHLLVVLVSGIARGPAFDACRWIVDQIKTEKIIRLLEV